jgi:SpoVK/Ycf46/Vps4 family AAA+-type ATPase
MLALRVPIPDSESRTLLWGRSLDGGTPNALTHLRMTSGNIVRTAAMARASATLGGAIDAAALRAAVRALDREGLDALAQRIDPAGPWSLLATSPETFEELNTLTARCRQRERLGAFVGEACSGVTPGVRALFKGPSGTGKTLAARMLAGALGMDIYRVDLASVVNKYIGETEKNLDRVFARAEELDVILLLDEGDALLTQRTAVQSANDRYANLETNFLLQRLESYSGILLVTTNAGDRIDSGFERRMDVVIEFALPDAAERRAIWDMHLPAAHDIDADMLLATSQRCALSGGQIRNAALHAALLAVDAGSRIGSSHIEAAVAREYRKAGGLSPLRARGGPR